ncbi:MAG: lipopolysaccharide biosynthesis protein [Acutalibacteraceae bacterium]
MKIERSKNATRNIFFGVIQKVYSILIPFATRTIMIYALGMNYLGLNSLFSSVLSVLNLAELGVGSAMVFSMYKPIAEDDEETICALMRLYRLYYRIIGGVILVVGLIITSFIPKIIKSDVPDGINIYVLYLMNLASTVFTYWLFAYKNCLLSAHQRNDVSTKISMVVSVVQVIAQILVLLITKNYYLYVLVLIISGILTNITTAFVVNKMYPQYKPVGNLPKEQVKSINGRVRDLFTSKIGSVVVDSADTIVISAFLGLTSLAVYQNYFYILTSIFGFVSIIFYSCTAGIGNSIITETEEKNFGDFKTFTFIISWLSCFCVCCLATLYQPFMEMWVGKNNMLSYGYVIVFCIYFFIKEINSLLNLYKDAAGIWHEDRFRPLITALANLCMNLIMVQFWGLYGILLSTILSMVFVGMPWLFHNLFTTIFHQGLLAYLKKMAIYVVVTVAICAICIFSCSFHMSSLIAEMILKLIISAVISNLLMFVLFFRTKEFKQTAAILDTITKGRIKILRKLME